MERVKYIWFDVKINLMATVKKTWLIDPALVQRARKILGTRTEAEAVTQALREVVNQDKIDKTFRKHGPVLAGIEEVFHDPAQSRWNS